MGSIVDNIDKNGMSANLLKIIAIFAMLIDHIAWAFIPTGTILAQSMHIIGRLTAPIMSYFVSEGFYHTRNVKKYALRLGIFAVISHIPFYYYMNGQWPIPFITKPQFKFQTGVIYTLFFGLLSLIVWNNEKINKNIKILLIILICIIATPGDWNYFVVLWVLFFNINRNNLEKQIKSFILISSPIMLQLLVTLISRNSNWHHHIFFIGVPLAIPFIKRYNGELGGSKHSKWLFYIFYPLHLMILGLIKYKLLI